MSGAIRIVLLVLSAGLAAAAALAQAPNKPEPFDAGAYPKDVQAALQNARDERRRQGGSGVTFAPGTVRKLDLNGDGRDDYIVDLREAECAGRPAAFCGTGGWSLDILVALRGGRFRTVFSDRVREYELLPPGRGIRSSSFRIGRRRSRQLWQSVVPWRTHRITRRKFEFKQPLADARASGRSAVNESAGTLPPFAASFVMTCLCSQMFIDAESPVSPV